MSAGMQVRSQGGQAWAARPEVTPVPTAPATVVILGLSQAATEIYGRPLLERILLNCQRAGISRFVVDCDPNKRGLMREAAGQFAADPGLLLVEIGKNGVPGLPANTACVMVCGNLVFAASHLARLLALQRAQPGQVVALAVGAGAAEAQLCAGPLTDLLDRRHATSHRPGSIGADLPYAMDGRESKSEAELRLARAMRLETAHTDGFMARWLDRRLSWRISRRLAATPITPNQVTWFNTALGLLIATLVASTSYWYRVGGGLLLLVSVTLDGVDGELARLKMTESEAGRRLDVLTDNLVEVAIFIGLLVGCYRGSGNQAYFYLLAILLGGFGFCAISVNRAVSLSKEQFKRWIELVERVAGRDFAYLIFVLALLNGFSWFAWGTAFGTWIFAGGLWILTSLKLRCAKVED
ncbi:MAG TPA: CDP-alcohol phosphatidyltransferase family protein [Candidatus Binataceae bacterium]|nr:CDP-alcohol phosphatidyltransferase family protein [Candidatus Binataceae bacterium]